LNCAGASGKKKESNSKRQEEGNFSEEIRAFVISLTKRSGNNAIKKLVAGELTPPGSEKKTKKKKKTKQQTNPTPQKNTNPPPKKTTPVFTPGVLDSRTTGPGGNIDPSNGGAS